MREIDWTSYRKCGICKAVTGLPCRAVSGAIARGRPDGAVKELAIPHPSRILLSGRQPYKAAGS
jgi:hypothetical protein